MRARLMIPIVAGVVVASVTHAAITLTGSAAAAASRDDPGRQVHTFNTQLAAHDDLGPDAWSPAWGHVQLKLVEAESGEYVPSWKGRLFNPAHEAFAYGGLVLSGAGGGLPGPGDDVPESSMVLTFFSEVDSSCDVIEFESGELGPEDHLPAEIGLAAIINPDILVGAFFTSGATAVIGRFGPSTPEVSQEVDRSGLAGRIVRCAG